MLAPLVTFWLSFFQFSAELLLHPSALVEDPATGLHRPLCRHVAQQDSQNTLWDGHVMWAERFLLQLLSEALEGLW